jgi:hypothetical protein
MKAAYHSITPLEIARVEGAPEEVETLNFLSGAPIPAGPPTPWTFDIEAEGPQLPHLLGGPIPFASERLLTVLAAAGVDNLQTFAAVLRVRSGPEHAGYSVLNVIGLVDATDAEASADALVLSPARSRGLSMFRLFQNPGTLLVDDHVLDALNRHRPVEGWGFAAFEIEMSEPSG